MTGHRKKSSESAVVRIAGADFSVGQEAEVPVCDLEVRLAGMTPETFHDNVDFGNPVGNEAW